MKKTGVTADTALRLSKVFGTSPELWLNLQTAYDIQIAKRQMGKDLAKIEPIGDQGSLGSARRMGGANGALRYVTH